MPLYDYKCVKCGGVITELRCIADMDRPCECPKCSKEVGFTITAQRIPTAPAPQFPGASGWQR